MITLDYCLHIFPSAIWKALERKYSSAVVCSPQKNEISVHIYQFPITGKLLLKRAPIAGTFIINIHDYNELYR